MSDLLGERGGWRERNIAREIKRWSRRDADQEKREGFNEEKKRKERG